MLKDAVPLAQVRRALVIKLRHHGDVLLSAPVFAALKAAAPHAELDALVYADTANMLTLHPAIDRVHTIGRDWRQRGLFGRTAAEWALLRTLRTRQYDLVIHLTEHRRGAWLTRLLAPRWAVAPKVAGRGGSWRRAFSHLYGQPANALRHTVEANLDALRRIGVQPPPEQRRVTLVAGNAAAARVDALLSQHGVTDFVLLHPASRWLFKCWTVAGWATVVRALEAAGHRVVVSAAPDATEQAMVRDILAQADSRRAVDLSGQLNLKELAALAARARAFAGVDSAPMHIAAAMDRPVTALFGPSGDRQWGPWRNPGAPAPTVIASTTHPCRPCGIDGCGGGKVSDCLVHLDPALVAAAVLSSLPT